MKSKKLVLIIGVAVLVVVSSFIISTLVRSNRESSQIDQQRSALEDLTEDPNRLLAAAKQAQNTPEAVERMEHRQAEYVDTLAQKLTKIMDGRSIKQDIAAIESGDEGAKLRNDAVIALMRQRSLSDDVRAELAITDRPEVKNSYYFTSSDLVFADQRTTEELNTLIATSLKELCQNGDADCLISFNTQSPVEGQVLTSIYPLKVSDQPLTYRIYAVLRVAGPRR